MLPEKLEAADRPFRSWTYENLTEEREHQLEILDLNLESTADDVRRVAISMRAQMREKGLNVESVKALRWILEKTNDCLNERQFLWFLLEDCSFKSIESMRSW